MEKIKNKVKENKYDIKDKINTKIKDNESKILKRTRGRPRKQNKISVLTILYHHIYTIIHKLHHEVMGEGFQCWKTLVKIITSTNLFGARSIETERYPVRLTRDECNLIGRSKKCDNLPMKCDEDECILDGTPKPVYNWMQTSVQS